MHKDDAVVAGVLGFIAGIVFVLLLLLANTVGRDPVEEKLPSNCDSVTETVTVCVNE